MPSCGGGGVASVVSSCTEWSPLRSTLYSLSSLRFAAKGSICGKVRLVPLRLALAVAIAYLARFNVDGFGFLLQYILFIYLSGCKSMLRFLLLFFGLLNYHFGVDLIKFSSILSRRNVN